ncbi:hypothetical protein AMAG_14036 [Allomyces macrogynus ATCC 38327]|uniref:Kelch repeat protein n=1 Tax=Allomyces macrogynus (strain ATCC 38327) TaxID=578462 RepID=A0A0L0T4L8_ALLM3|nr:hypothetical protein AMAG_14036 [Allomyces macrogynus ATCC 38327]|eukprot:KNE69464.1 hypothetical protein AMAG_14036 [Allomyces macrogynus ATCC 38327]
MMPNSPFMQVPDRRRTTMTNRSRSRFLDGPMALARLVAVLALVPVAMAAFTMTTSQSTSGGACAIVGSRIYSFFGYLANTGTTKFVDYVNGAYSVDLIKTVAAGRATGLTTHGTMNSSIAGVINPATLVVNQKVYIAGGLVVLNKTSEDDFANKVMYQFDPSSGSTKRMSFDVPVGYKHSVPGTTVSAGDSPKKLAMFLYGGTDTSSGKTKDLNWLETITEQGVAANTNSTSGPSPRRLASMSRYNSTHHLLSGGFNSDGSFLDDVWTLDDATATWTKVGIKLYHGRYQHRTVYFKDRYVIHIGGYQVAKPYTLVEYIDTAGSSIPVAGTISNPSSGPTSLTGGCAAIVDNTIAYLGGLTTTTSGDDNESAAPFMSMLAVNEVKPGSLSFQWVTGSSSTSSGSGSNSTSSTTGGSTSGGSSSDVQLGPLSFSSGTVAGATLGVLAVAVLILIFTRHRILAWCHNRVKKPLLTPAPPPPPPPPAATTPPTMTPVAVAMTGGSMMAPTYPPPAATMSPQPTGAMPQQPMPQQPAGTLNDHRLSMYSTATSTSQPTAGWVPGPSFPSLPSSNGTAPYPPAYPPTMSPPPSYPPTVASPYPPTTMPTMGSPYPTTTTMPTASSSPYPPTSGPLPTSGLPPGPSMMAAYPPTTVPTVTPVAMPSVATGPVATTAPSTSPQLASSPPKAQPAGQVEEGPIYLPTGPARPAGRPAQPANQETLYLA